MISRYGKLALWMLALVSLALNVYLLASWFGFRAAVAAALSNAQELFSAVAAESLHVTVSVDQDVPIDATIPIDQEISIPLDFDYPLSTTVVTAISLPLLGRQELVFPVETVVPIHYTFTTHLQLQVPISFTYHLVADIPVQVALPAQIGDSVQQWLLKAEQQLR